MKLTFSPFKTHQEILEINSNPISNIVRFMFLKHMTDLDREARMVGLCEYFQNLNHPFLGSVTQDTHSYNQNRNIFNSITSLFTDKVWYRTCCESFKGTVSVISSNSSYKDCNVRFRTLKHLSEQVSIFCF